MMQDLWRLNVTWDEDLPNNHKEDWMRWLHDIKHLNWINTPRAYFPKPMQTTQLHIFCDSSKLAYGAVAYLRGATPTNETYSTLILAKSKVAPVKTQTLPRLELLAAVLGSKLSQYLTQTLQSTIQISQVTLWSDSNIVLSWICSTKPSKQQFIQNRVQVIKQNTTKYSWKYCPSTSNPADLLTRGVDVKTFISKSDIWYSGPPWLVKPANEWPSMHEDQQEIGEEEPTDMTASINFTNVVETTSLLNVININKYSTLNRLIRATALIIHIARKWRLRDTKHNDITALDMKTALIALLKAVQHANYGDIISKIQNRPKNKLPAITYQLGLYIDERDGLLRCRGRLHHSELPHNAKFPVLIPKENYLSILIVRATHLVLMHGGVRETLTQIRQTYWIPKGRQLAKKVINKCVTCRKVEGPPFRSVDTPPLPETRVTGSYPFRVTGIDYAGPLYVRDARKETSKVYICLFTCAAIRAIHLELVEDQTTDAFLRAFRRFGSRRGIPECIISDNAKTFKAGSQELQALKTKILETAESQRFLANQGIKWKFITERAPWWGGFYERMIGLMKRRLKKTIGKVSLNLIELQTILTETEAVINSRPITFPYGEIEDGPPLTPSHFLSGYRLLNLPPKLEAEEQDDPDYTPHDISGKDLTKRAQYHQKIMQDFWKQWRDEYLTSLREHHSSQRSTKSGTSVATKGNVVLIHDDTPRNQWKLGLIIQLHPGRDGNVRSVTLRTSNGREISRPIEKLYPLEVSDDAEQNDQNIIEEEHAKITTARRLPARIAAQKATQKIKELYN